MKAILKKSLISILLFVTLFYIISVLSVKANYKAEARYSASFGNISLYSTNSATETINYTNREVTYIETTKAVPLYSQISSLSNSCGATAGAIIVGFYDKYFDELVPDYATYLSNGRYKSADSVYIPKLMSELYTLMRTNVDAEGVNQTDCRNGLNTYVKNHGRTLTYSSVKSINIINESLITTSINNNNPAILFCSKMDLYKIASTSTADTLTCTNFSGAHIAVAYGLYVVNYYNGSTLFRTDKYVKVATGLSIMTDGYLKISSTDWCIDAYSVKIS